jgi:hypothetical protein
MLSFLWPLTPPIPTSEASCSKKQEIIGIPLVFFQKVIREEYQYSTFDQELFAAYLSIRHFHYFC